MTIRTVVVVTCGGEVAGVTGAAVTGAAERAACVVGVTTDGLAAVGTVTLLVDEAVAGRVVVANVVLVAAPVDWCAELIAIVEWGGVPFEPVASMPMATPAMRRSAVAAATTDHLFRLRSKLAGLLTLEPDATAVVGATAAVGGNRRPSLPRRQPAPGASPDSTGDRPIGLSIEIAQRSQKTALAATGCPLGHDGPGPEVSVVPSLIVGPHEWNCRLASHRHDSFSTPSFCSIKVFPPKSMPRLALTRTTFGLSK